LTQMKAYIYLVVTRRPPCHAIERRTRGKFILLKNNTML